MHAIYLHKNIFYYDLNSILYIWNTGEEWNEEMYKSSCKYFIIAYEQSPLVQFMYMFCHLDPMG